MTQQTMSEKDMLLGLWEREHDCTIRVLREVPAGQEEFRPAPRSSTLARLVWTFILEEKVMEMVANRALDLSRAGNQPDPPKMTIDELIDTCQAAHRESFARVQAMSERDFNETIKFFAGPKKIEDVRIGQVFMNFVLDKIHHRGQLSVYLRMLDAKVPSIYGPSADEPWN